MINALTVQYIDTNGGLKKLFPNCCKLVFLSFTMLSTSPLWSAGLNFLHSLQVPFMVHVTGSINISNDSLRFRVLTLRGNPICLQNSYYSFIDSSVVSINFDQIGILDDLRKPLIEDVLYPVYKAFSYHEMVRIKGFIHHRIWRMFGSKYKLHKRLQLRQCHK